MSVFAVVIDTNVLVASEFNPNSQSAQIVEQVRCGQLRMVWTEETRQEAEFIVGKIPPISWDSIVGLFCQEDCYVGELHPEKFYSVSDKDDIKFAALCDATGAILITMDKNLLSVRDMLDMSIMMPFEFLSLENQTTESSSQPQFLQSQ